MPKRRVSGGRGVDTPEQIERIETFEDPSTETGLDPVRERFAQEFVNGPYAGNRTRSAIIAGAGSTYLSSSKLGSEYSREKAVAARIAQLLDERRERLAVTEARVLEEYGKLAFSDPGEVWDFSKGKEYPELRPLNEIPAHARQGIKKVKVKRRTVVIDGVRTNMSDDEITVEHHDKKGALDTLAKHLGMLKDDQAPVVNVFVVEVPPRLDAKSWGEKYRALAGGR